MLHLAEVKLPLDLAERQLKTAILKEMQIASVVGWVKRSQNPIS
jgi:hypothetical protein